MQAERRSAWLQRLYPEASTAARLAARCQHLMRWSVPRGEYDDGRAGYLKWRKDLSRFHADEAEKVLRREGWDEDTIERVRAINLKRGIKVDADVQTMEDALCLAFLDHELEAFAAKHSDEKVIDILAKTWRKMSPRAHAAAATLQLNDRCADLVSRALRRAMEAD